MVMDFHKKITFNRILYHHALLITRLHTIAH
jgi:hypothetical protein